MKVSEPERLRVCFVLSEYGLHNSIIERYAEARPNDYLSIVKVPLVLRGKNRSETVQRIAPKLSRRFIVTKILEALLLFAVTFSPKMLKKGAIFRRLRLIAWRSRLPFLKTEDIMSQHSLDFIRAQDPDVVVTLFHQIVRKELIKIPRVGVVNAHPGLLPQFAGIQPYFWALSNGARETGATLHCIEDETLDTGRILAQARFPLEAKMSVQLVYYLTSCSIAQMLGEVIPACARGEILPQPQEGDRSYFSWPDTAAIDRMRDRGHRLLSIKDFLGIITGRYDSFVATNVDINWG